MSNSNSRDAEPDTERRAFIRGAVAAAAGGLIGVLAGCGAGREPQAGSDAAPVAGASPTESALIAAARQEGRLMLYTGSEESIVAALGKAFQDRYGVQLEYLRLSSNEIATRYTAEAQAGRTIADVVMTGDYELFQIFAGKGWLAKPDPAAVPGLERWPAEYRDEHTATVSIIPYTIAINTDRVKVPPRDWSYLTSPEAKGGLVTLDGKRVNLVAIAGWDLMLSLYGEEFLRKVGQQQLRLVDSGPSAVQQLASGAANAYFPCSMTNAQSMIAQGAPVRGILPDNVPYTGVLTQAAISANALHSHAARLFLAFLLTEQGQKLLNVVGSSPVNTPGTPPLRSGFVKPDFASTAANKAKIIQLLAM